MKIKKVPGSAGNFWIIEGLSLAQKTPLLFLKITLLILILFLFLSQTPIVGPILPILISPVLTMGFLDTIKKTDSCDPKGISSFDFLYSLGKNQRWLSLLGLGCINFLIIFILFSSTSLLTSNHFPLLNSIANTPDALPTEMTQPPITLLLFILLAILAQAIMICSPFFIYWENIPVLQSIFFSYVVFVTNKKAFFLYGFSWIILLLLVGFFFSMLQIIIPYPALHIIFFFLIEIFFFISLHCSLYIIYKNLIQNNETH